MLVNIKDLQRFTPTLLEAFPEKVCSTDTLKDVHMIKTNLPKAKVN
jgi:hypothetical protein